MRGSSGKRTGSTSGCWPRVRATAVLSALRGASGARASTCAAATWRAQLPTAARTSCGAHGRSGAPCVSTPRPRDSGQRATARRFAAICKVRLASHVAWRFLRAERYHWRTCTALLHAKTSARIQREQLAHWLRRTSDVQALVRQADGVHAAVLIRKAFWQWKAIHERVQALDHAADRAVQTRDQGTLVHLPSPRAARLFGLERARCASPARA